MRSCGSLPQTTQSWFGPTARIGYDDGSTSLMPVVFCKPRSGCRFRSRRSTPTARQMGCVDGVDAPPDGVAMYQFDDYLSHQRRRGHPRHQLSPKNLQVSQHRCITLTHHSTSEDLRFHLRPDFPVLGIDLSHAVRAVRAWDHRMCRQCHPKPMKTLPVWP